MSYWSRLRQVIEYMSGNVDIYDGNHAEIVAAWDRAWDEMTFQGFDPGSASGIRQYIARNE